MIMRLALLFIGISLTLFPVSVCLLDVVAVGTDQTSAEEVTKRFSGALAAVSSFTLFANSDVENVKRKYGVRAQCYENDCALAIGQGLGADYVFYGNLEKDGEKIKLSVWMYDINSKRRSGTFGSYPDHDAAVKAAPMLMTRVLNSITGKTAPIASRGYSLSLSNVTPAANTPVGREDYIEGIAVLSITNFQPNKFMLAFSAGRDGAGAIYDTLDIADGNTNLPFSFRIASQYFWDSLGDSGTPVIVKVFLISDYERSGGNVTLKMHAEALVKYSKK